MPRLTSHPVLLGLAAAATVGFGAYGLVTGASLTVPYVAVVAVLGAVVLRLDHSVGFSDVVAVGLSAWAVAHLAGGLVALGDGRVLYNAEILPHLRYDNFVHFFGFGVAGIAGWEVLLHATAGGAAFSPRTALLVVWLFGMGTGALNEVVEFAVSQTVEDSNVGGYLNTGRDLVANMLGAASAGVLVSRTRSSPSPAGRSRPDGRSARRRRPVRRISAGRRES